ncbi:MAG: hypothetical protein R3258_01895 [Acidimicrobiia bacterium]|nr:hypothetical protein [Acidimicrobiia bacterium]
MKRWTRIAALLALFALVTTSCMTIRQFSFSKTNLDLSEDDITSMRLRLKPESSTSVFEGHIIVLVGYDEEIIPLNRKEWQDLDGHYGVAKAGISHNALRDQLLMDGVCNLPGGGDAEDIEASYTTWRAFRTDIEIDSGDIDATSRINFVHNIGISDQAAANEVAQVVAIVGTWNDDGDTIPESTDTYICNSVIFTSLTFKP